MFGGRSSEQEFDGRSSEQVAGKVKAGGAPTYTAPAILRLLLTSHLLFVLKISFFSIHYSSFFPAPFYLLLNNPGVYGYRGFEAPGPGGSKSRASSV